MRWEEPLAALGDQRQDPRIPILCIVRSAVVMFLSRLGSLNALAQTSCSRFWSGHLPNGKLPSADTMGRVATGMYPDEVRNVLHGVYGRLKRGKAMRDLPCGFIAAILDGHESHATYRRRCSGCLSRTVQTAQGERTQYYHRYVALHLLSGNLKLMLDAEPQRNGEDEVACALRLLERVLEKYPRAFELVLADGLYARADFFNYLTGRGKYVLTTLKDENRILLQDARALFATMEPTLEQDGNVHRTCWDAEGFTTWPQVQGLVRVVRSVERKTVVRQLDGKKNTEESEWFWVTTLPQSLTSTGAVTQLGHGRWSIENRGFNEMANRWHADHVYRHEPTAMLVLWLMSMLCLNVFLAFYHRDLKPAARQAASMLHVARQIAAELYARIPKGAPAAPT